MTSPRLRVVLDAFDQFTTRLVRKMVLDIVANLTASPGQGGTPVDTAWARNNWVPNIGGPADRTGLESPSRDERRARASNARSRQEQGKAEVASSYRPKQGPVHITNNVPYIVRLNEGSSRQAPAGFVQAAIAKAVRVDLGGGLGL